MRVEDLPDRVAADPALVRRGRHLSTTFLLEVGDARWLVDVRDGQLDVRPALNYVGSWRFALRAPAEVWDAFWQAKPKPGYADILGLARARRLRIEGDLEPLMAHLLFIKGVLASLRPAAEHAA